MASIHDDPHRAAQTVSVVKKMLAASKAENRPVSTHELYQEFRNRVCAESGASGRQLDALVAERWKQAVRPHEPVAVTTATSPHAGLVEATQQARRAERKRVKAGMRHRRADS